MVERSGQRFYVITGGTMVHVAPHFSLCAPAYGSVGRQIALQLRSRFSEPGEPEVRLIQTQMARGDRPLTGDEQEAFTAAGIHRLETNDELEQLISTLVCASETRCIVLAAAVCDWRPTDVANMSNIRAGARTDFGKHTERLQTSNGDLCLGLSPADKIVRKIRQKRKDIFLVAFKATAGLTSNKTYAAGLRLLKQTSANLVLANDVGVGTNMIVTPEEFPYHCNSREKAVGLLAEMIVARTKLDFVRTDVVDTAVADVVALQKDRAIPQNFSEVITYLIAHKAFRPFLGKTAGHFGCKILKDDYAYRQIASRRKVDHNKVFEEGMVRIFGYEDGRIQVGGGKPSVGEHTQHQIYERLGDKVHSIVHFHCTRKLDHSEPPTASQKEFECGSIQCGTNTAEHMIEIAPGIWAVHLIGHGPNIAFHKDVAAEQVIAAIEQSWDLSHKTGGLVEDSFR